MAVVAVVTAARRTIFAVRVRMIVMRAGGIRVEGERAPEQCRNGSVRAARHTAVERDARISERRSRPAADAAADERIDAAFPQKARKRAMPAAVGRHDLRGDDLSVLRRVDLELLGP